MAVPASKWAPRLLFLLLLILVGTFFVSGDLVWVQGWVYFLVSAAVQVADMWIVVNFSGLFEERTNPPKGGAVWDQILARIMVLVGSLSTLIVASLDHRFDWSPQFGDAFFAFGVLTFVVGAVMGVWALAVNRWFSAIVRLQSDRGHKVVSSGPYGIVRHPSYLGGFLAFPATALILGSIYALIPAFIGCIAIVIRTNLEDYFLKENLEGYREYADKTRYRLLPGIW
jgi:protein-S-isoprenylcysteine O-methyltransferase Ste14